MSKLRSFLIACLFIFPAIAWAAQGNLVNAKTLTITTGATWQSLFPINNNRTTLWIENPATSTSQGIVTAESIFIYFVPAGGACLASGTTGAYELVAGGSLVMTPNGFVTNQAICVYAATIGHVFQAAQTQ
jgi:hypothetical protein